MECMSNDAAPELATGVVRDPMAQMVDVSLADPVNKNPEGHVDNVTGQVDQNLAGLVDNPTGQVGTSGLEKIDDGTLKNFLHFVAASPNPKALLEAFMKSNK